MTARSSELSPLVALVSEAYGGPTWHGPALRVTLRGIGAAEALWRSAPGRNRIWDLTLHAAYSKHRVLRYVDPALAPRFPRALERDWWPRLPEEPDEGAWEDDRALLESYHERLLEAIVELPTARLAEGRRSGRFTLAQQIAHSALHDTYHAGQIRLISRLYAASR